ncbi:unnamed protein product, partial [Timema podura]|nr:unnamed protein product [Timema podura]
YLFQGVESEMCPSFNEAQIKGKPVLVPTSRSLADGLAVPQVGIHSFSNATNKIDRMVVVKEDSIALAILTMVEKEKSVVEGAGAVSMAAILSGQLDLLKGKRVVLVVSGGNIDTTVLSRALHKGMAIDGRLLKVGVVVDDRPGCIAELCQVFSELQVNMRHLMHERACAKADVFSVKVSVICESRSREHSLNLIAALQNKYDHVVLGDSKIYQLIVIDQLPIYALYQVNAGTCYFQKQIQHRNYEINTKILNFACLSTNNKNIPPFEDKTDCCETDSQSKANQSCYEDTSKKSANQDSSQEECQSVQRPNKSTEFDNNDHDVSSYEGSDKNSSENVRCTPYSGDTFNNCLLEIFQDVPGSLSRIFKPCEEFMLKEGVSKDEKLGVYKNPEYFSYHAMSFILLMEKLSKYRLPQPSKKRSEKPTGLCKEEAIKNKHCKE